MPEIDDLRGQMFAHLAALDESADDEERAAHEAAVDKEWKRFDRSQRGQLVSLVAAAANTSMNNVTLAKMGRFDKSAFSSKKTEAEALLAEQLQSEKEFAPLLVRWLLNNNDSDKASFAELETNLLQRDGRIHKLRKKLRKAKRLQSAGREAEDLYLAAAHEEFHAEIQDRLRQREEVVVSMDRHLKPVDTPEEEF